MKGSPSWLLAAMLSLPLLAQAAEPAQCSTVNFSDVGWTDITATTATTSVVLNALGYKTKTTMSEEKRRHPARAYLGWAPARQ